MRLLALAVPLAYVSPLAVVTWRSNVNHPLFWAMTLPFVLGVIAYPGYAAVVLRREPSTWQQTSLSLGRIASISGLALVLWTFRDVLRSPRIFSYAVIGWWPVAIAVILCPALAL